MLLNKYLKKDLPCSEDSYVGSLSSACRLSLSTITIKRQRENFNLNFHKEYLKAIQKINHVKRIVLRIK